MTRPSKSDFEQWNLAVLGQRADAVKTVVDALQRGADESGAAQKNVANNFQGKAADSIGEQTTTNVSSLSRFHDTADGLRAAYANGTGKLTPSVNGLRGVLRDAQQQGFTVTDDWKLRDAQRPNMHRAYAQEILQQNLDGTLKNWDQARGEVASDINKANQALSDPPAPQLAPDSTPTPGQPPKKDEPKKDDKPQDQGKPGGEPSGGTKPNAAEVAAQYEGKNTADLVGHSDLPLQPNKEVDKNCANFASAVLVKNGQLDPSQQTLSVNVLYNELLAKGWHPVPADQAPPGAVAIFGPNHSQHVELVSSNDGGKIKLIGSNNTNHDAADSQRVGYGNPWGTLTYLVPPS